MAHFKDLVALCRYHIGRDKERFIARLNRNIVQDPSTGCWLAQRVLDHRGHARMSFRMQGQHGLVMLHRLLWVLHHRQNVPEDMELDHICTVRNCCNPEHLQLVTRAENCQWMWDRRRK